jgi:hypothetical protein
VHRKLVKESASSSHSDVGCYIIIRKLLDFIFNSRLHMQLKIYNYRGISFRKVAYTIYDVRVSWFKEYMDFYLRTAKCDARAARTGPSFLMIRLVASVTVTQKLPMLRLCCP